MCYSRLQIGFNAEYVPIDNDFEGIRCCDFQPGLLGRSIKKNLPSKVRLKSIRQEPKRCSINFRPGRPKKMLKPDRPSRCKKTEYISCREPPYQNLDRSRPRKPPGHRSRRRKMPVGPSVGAIDPPWRGRQPGAPIRECWRECRKFLLRPGSKALLSGHHSAHSKRERLLSLHFAHLQ